MLLASALWAASAAAVPASLRGEADLHDLAESFLSSAVAGDVAAGFRTLAAYWPSAQARIGEVIPAVEKRRVERRKRLGLSNGFERVRVEKLGQRVLSLVYLERFDRAPVVWRLTFYRPDQAWLLVQVEDSEELGDYLR